MVSGLSAVELPTGSFFMGDVGSYLLGGAIGLLVLIGLHAHVPLEALLGPEAIFLADTGWTLLRRVARGEDWTSAHRTHVYQQLRPVATSHTGTTMAVTTLVVMSSVLGSVSLTGYVWARFSADTAGVLLLAAYLARPIPVRRSAGSGRIEAIKIVEARGRKFPFAKMYGGNRFRTNNAVRS